LSQNFVQEQIVQASLANFAAQTAEQAVIGMMLLDSKLAEQFATELTESDFYYPEYGKVFRGIQATLTKQQTVDMITVDASLAKLFPNDKLAGTMVECAQSNIKFSVHKISDYVQIVKDLSIRRKAIYSVEELLIRLKDPTQDIADLLDKLSYETSKLTQSKHVWENIQDVLLATYEYLEKRQRGDIKSITTGIGALDRLIGGFFGGEFTVIGARPSVGKSAFGANIALSAANKGFRVAVVSCEMSDVQYGSRILSHEAWVDGMKMRTAELDGDDWDRIATALGTAGELPIDFMFTVRTVEDLVKECRKKVERKELDLLIVDYLQLMQTERKFNQENLRIGHISRTLKMLSLECNIPVIALAQVNRETDGSMPKLKDLKASGDIEQDTDGVIFLHRPGDSKDPFVRKEDKEHFVEYGEKGNVYLAVSVAKQRNGAIGWTNLIFEPDYMRYTEIMRGVEAPPDRSKHE